MVYLSNSPDAIVWTNLQGEKKVLKYHRLQISKDKDGIADGHHLPSVPMHRDKKHHKK